MTGNIVVAVLHCTKPPPGLSAVLLEQLEQEHHVWFVIPESVRDEATLASCRSVLSPNEQSHYHRFKFPADRQRYLVSHAMVRRVLSQYANISPRHWLFERTRHGRPEIANTRVPDLRFNLTHTHGLAACIITLTEPCGIDAEQLDQRHRLLSVAKRMFSAPEYERLSRLDGEPFLDDFYTRWTLREAYVKARGIGISFPTRKLLFEIRGDDEVAMTLQSNLGGTGEEWSFTIMRPLPGYVTSTAVRDNGKPRKKVVTHVYEF